LVTVCLIASVIGHEDVEFDSFRHGSSNGAYFEST
jgi:hypothetical protein